MKPLLLHYFVTYRCNARCSFCTIWDAEKWDHGPSPSWATMDRNLRDARSLGARFVDFTGGEPLLYRELPRALRLAKVLGYRTSVTTNCVLYGKRGPELAGNVDFLHFSLDAADRELHDRIRGVPCFDKVMESIDLAEELGERPDLLFTATEETYGEVEPLARLAQKRGLMLIVNPVFSYFDNPSLSDRGLEHIERFADHPNVYTNPAFHRLIRAGGNDVESPTCHAAEATIVISPDDRLLLPCFHAQMESIPIDGKLREVRRGETVRNLIKRDGRHEPCRGCTINCYMDPSFMYRVDGYFWQSLWAKARYAWLKG